VTPDARAKALATRRDELLARLPRQIRGAQSLSHADRDLVVQDAIVYVVLENTDPIAEPADLERLFWTACDFRVRTILRGRTATVRGRFERASEEALGELADDADPSVAVEQAEENALAEEFAATLGERERRVLRVKYFSGTVEPLGYKKIAERLGMTQAAARAADRAIGRSLERFAALYTAGRLCPTRQVELSALAAGTADRHQARVALAHVAHCVHCEATYAEQLRAIRSAAFERKVASLLPVAEVAQDRSRIRGAWDALLDHLARPFAHDGAASATQVAAGGAGRGAGTAVALKVAAALCLTGAGAAGTCIEAGLINSPLERDKPSTHTVGTSRPSAATRAPEARLVTHVLPKPTPTPRRKRTQSNSRRGSTQGGTRPSSHERTPASPAPADAAPNGASEFDPTYEPSQPAKPAPVPAAPGASEFF
jgi:hypothetical protein